MFRCIFILLFIFLLVQCTNKTSNVSDMEGSSSDTVSVELDIPIINWKFLNRIKNTKEDNPEIDRTKYTVFVYFDGSCSSCVVAFLEWFQKFKKVKSDADCKYLVIAKAEDEYLIEYYLDQFNLEIDKGEYLLIDQNYAFNEFNPFVKQSEGGIILADDENKVIALGNPFESEKILNLFIKHGVFRK